MDYKELIVWQKAIELVENIYKEVREFPKYETYVLPDQIRIAVISVPSNIAEGSGRNTTKEFIQFLYIALGSICELETEIIIANRLGYIKGVNNILNDISEIRKMLNGLINSPKRKGDNE